MRASKRCGRRRFKLNNAGVSLIELVVALLILAIITVPLLQVFTSTINVNKFNAQRNAANTVAANIMEAVKVYGIDGTAAAIQNAKNTDAAKCLGMTVAGYGVSTVDEYLSPTPGAEPKTYSGMLTGIREGTGTFNAKITVNTEYKYNAGADTYSYLPYNYAFFDKENSFDINPVDLEWYYDDAEVEWYRDLNVAYVAHIDSVNREHPEDPPISANTATYDNIKNAIDRELVINISNDYSNPSKTQYAVSADFIYTFHANYGGSFLGSDQTYSRSLLGNEFDNREILEKLENLYVFYVPFPYMARTAFDKDFNDKVNVTGEETAVNNTPLLKNVSNVSFRATVGVSTRVNQWVTINNNTDKEINVYLVVQGNSGTEQLTVNKAGTHPENLNVYCNSTLFNGDPEGETPGLVNKKSDDKAVIATIKVEVFDSGDSSASLIELNSTIEQ